MKYLCASLFVFQCCWSSICAQTIQGKIVDQDSGEPLSFASISVKGTRIGTVSNVDGNFTLHIPSDTCTITASMIGYQNGAIKLPSVNRSKQILIQLSATSSHLDEVVVTGEHENVFQMNQKISMIKMTPANLSALPNVGERDILRAFQLMPGISAANENSAGLYVRGGTPDQSLVLYDGFTVYHVDHLFGFFSAFNPNAVKDVQVYKGAFGSKFGGRLSSVAEITGKEGNRKNFNIGGDISLLSLNIFTEFPVGQKVSVLFAARRSWKSPLYKKIFETLNPDDSNDAPNRPSTGGNLPSGGPSGGGNPSFLSDNNSVASFFYDLNGKVTFKPTEKDVIAISLYNGTDKMDNTSQNNFSAISSESKDLTKWGNSGASLKWSRQWSAAFYSNTLVSHSSYFSLRERSNSRFNGQSTTTRRGLKEDNVLGDFTVKTDFEWKHSQDHQTDFGFNVTKNDIDYKYMQNDTTTIIDRTTTGGTYSGYIQHKMFYNDSKLMVLPGIRYNHYDVTGNNYYEPRLSMSYLLSSKISVKASAGKYYQFAKRVIREDILEGSRDFWTLADDDRLPVASAVHIIGGASYETDNYLLDVEAYYKRLSGLSEYSLRFSPSSAGRPGSFSYDESFFQGTGDTKGMDFLIQKKFGILTGWIGYTWSETLYNFDVYSLQPYHASQDVTHEFKFAGVYRMKSWDFAITWIYATGRPYTAPTGGYTITLLDGTEVEYITVTSKNSLRLPDYHRLDAAVRYNWIGKRKGENSLSFSVFNVYNRENVWYKTFEIEDDQLAETNVSFLGITPNVTLTIKLR